MSIIWDREDMHTPPARVPVPEASQCRRDIRALCDCVRQRSARLEAGGSHPSHVMTVTGVSRIVHKGHS